MLGPVSGSRRSGGQRKQRLNEIIDWKSLKLPEVVHLTEGHVRYREFVQSRLRSWRSRPTVNSIGPPRPHPQEGIIVIHSLLASV